MSVLSLISSPPLSPHHHPPYHTPTTPTTQHQRRRADGLSFVRDEAAKEAVKQLVPVLDLFEELEARFAGVSDEASLKVLGGYRNLQGVFGGKAERLGLKAMATGAYLRGIVCMCGYVCLCASTDGWMDWARMTREK